MRRVLFAMLTVLVGSGCLCGGCMCPSSYGYKDFQEYRNAEFADRRKKAQSVIDALEKYKTARGRYPEKLDDLVAEKFLDAVPDLSANEDHQGKPGRVQKARGPEYAATAEAFALRYSFSFAEQAWTTAKDHGFDYSSATGSWQTFYAVAPRPLAPPTKK